MAQKIPPFEYALKDNIHVYSFPDAPIPDVSITVADPEYDQFKRLMGTVTAKMGDIEANPARINLLNQKERVDFHAVAAVLDGKVDWHRYLLVVVPHLQKQLKAQAGLNLQESPSAWEVFSLADAYRPRHPPVELVTGLLPLPSLAIVYGAPGTLKSFGSPGIPVIGHKVL
jgi:hypothetical protein